MEFCLQVGSFTQIQNVFKRWRVSMTLAETTFRCLRGGAFFLHVGGPCSPVVLMEAVNTGVCLSFTVFTHWDSL